MWVDLLDCVHKPSSKFKASFRFKLLSRSQGCTETKDCIQDLNEQGHDIANSNNANNEKREAGAIVMDCGAAESVIAPRSFAPWVKLVEGAWEQEGPD